MKSKKYANSIEDKNPDFNEIRACRYLSLIAKTGLIAALSSVEYKVLTAYLVHQVDMKSYTLGVGIQGFSASLNIGHVACKRALDTLHSLGLAAKLDESKSELMNNIRFSLDVFEEYHTGIDYPEGETGAIIFPKVDL